MNRKFRLISIAGIVLFCALTYFAFSSTSALAAGPAPQPGAPTTQRPPVQQKPPAQPKQPAKKLVCPPTVRYRDRGDAVRKLQTALNRQSFRNSRGRSLAVNGVFDNDTLFALKNFEARHHLKVDGVAGPNVWQQLGQCNLR